MGFGGDIPPDDVQVGIQRIPPGRHQEGGLDQILFSGHRYLVGSVREKRKTSFHVKPGGLIQWEDGSTRDVTVSLKP